MTDPDRHRNRDIGVGPAPCYQGTMLYRNSWALVVGINRYDDPRIPALEFAERDAQAVAALLPSLGFPRENIRLLLGGGLTRERLLEALEEDLNARMGAQDRLLIFFAGHAVSAEVHQQRRGYLLMPNSRLFGEWPGPDRPHAEKPPAPALEMRNLLNTVAGLPAKHRLLLLDSCFSGFMVHGRKVGEVKTNDPRLLRWTQEPVTQVLTAGRSGQVASEKGLYGHGVFTWHVLKGLQGNADPRGDGLITFHELATFVKGRVNEEEDVDQDPQLGTLGEGEFLFLNEQAAAQATARRQREEAERKQREEEERKRREEEQRQASARAAQAVQEQERQRRAGEQARIEAQRKRARAKRTTWWVIGIIGAFVIILWLTGIHRSRQVTIMQSETQVTTPIRPTPPARQGEPRPAPSASRTTTINGVDFEFIVIPAGEFDMGSERGCADEKPVHRVSITRPFEMSRCETTKAQWRAVVRKNPELGSSQADNEPVMVGWREAHQFFEKLNDGRDSYCYRLPTEAEWEYAARAGTAGESSNELSAVAWYLDNSWVGDSSSLHAVGQKQPNAWGLHDMLGNVSEWCLDWYGRYPSGSATDPVGPESGSYRVIRGGSAWQGARRASVLRQKFCNMRSARRRSL